MSTTLLNNSLSVIISIRNSQRGVTLLVLASENPYSHKNCEVIAGSLTCLSEKGLSGSIQPLVKVTPSKFLNHRRKCTINSMLNVGAAALMLPNYLGPMSRLLPLAIQPHRLLASGRHRRYVPCYCASSLAPAPSASKVWSFLIDIPPFRLPVMPSMVSRHANLSSTSNSSTVVCQSLGRPHDRSSIHVFHYSRA